MSKLTTNKPFIITLRLSERDYHLLTLASDKIKKNKSDTIRFILKSYLILMEKYL